MKKSAGQKTREKILNIGLNLWPDVTVTNIAEKADLTYQAVIYHYPKEKLKNAIAEHAIEVDDKKVVAQLILANHKFVRNMTSDEKTTYLQSV